MPHVIIYFESIGRVWTWKSTCGIIHTNIIQSFNSESIIILIFIPKKSWNERTIFNAKQLCPPVCIHTFARLVCALFFTATHVHDERVPLSARDVVCICIRVYVCVFICYVIRFWCSAAGSMFDQHNTPHIAPCILHVYTHIRLHSHTSASTSVLQRTRVLSCSMSE